MSYIELSSIMRIWPSSNFLKKNTVIHFVSSSLEITISTDHINSIWFDWEIG